MSALSIFKKTSSSSGNYFVIIVHSPEFIKTVQLAYVNSHCTVTAKLISAFVFATRIVVSLLFKSKISGF